MNKESTNVEANIDENINNNDTSTLLRLENLTCIRESRLLFDQLNFDINAGDIVQVEGPNGSGKTSLLRILSGLSQPYEGQVYFQGQNITKYQEAFHQQLIYLGHLPGVKGEMTAIENLQFNLKLHGNELLDETKIEQILSMVNLTGFEDSLASHLSAGQHRRISLARLYAQQSAAQQSTAQKSSTSKNASIWILDEPFTAIDKEGVLALEALFLQHTKQGGCIILTTHQDLITIAPSQIKKITLDYSFE